MFLLFDIGGTKTRLAVSHDGKTFEEPEIFETPEVYADGVQELVSRAKEHAGGKKYTAAAGGIAGPFDRKKGALVASPNLSGWVGKPLVRDLKKKLGVPVSLENDSALVALGEATHGAGKGADIVAYLTVSTGVGGARIVNGAIDSSNRNTEPGHQMIDIDKTLIPGAQGTDLESYISGRAVEARMGMKPYEITDERFWNDCAKILAHGVFNTIVHWTPDVVVLGGSMMKKVGIPVSAVEKHLKEIAIFYPNLPKIKKAELEDFGGLYGGLALCKKTK